MDYEFMIIYIKKLLRNGKQKEKNITYFRSVCFGLGREYFKYPSQGTFLRPARTEIISLILQSRNKISLLVLQKHNF